MRPSLPHLLLRGGDYMARYTTGAQRLMGETLSGRAAKPSCRQVQDWLVGLIIHKQPRQAMSRQVEYLHLLER